MPEDRAAELMDYKPDLQSVSLQNVEVAADSPCELRIELILPSGHQLNQDASIHYKITKLAGEAVHLEQGDAPRNAPPISPFVIPFKSGPAGKTSEMKISADVHYCSDGDSSSCLIKTLTIALRVRAVAKGAAAVDIHCTINR